MRQQRWRRGRSERQERVARWLAHLLYAEIASEIPSTHLPLLNGRRERLKHLGP
jgi:hypothetical protein